MNAPLVDPAVLDKTRGWRPYVEAKLGFRNHWYPAVFASQVGEGEPVETELLGESILLEPHRRSRARAAQPLPAPRREVQQEAGVLSQGHHHLLVPRLHLSTGRTAGSSTSSPTRRAR